MRRAYVLKVDNLPAEIPPERTMDSVSSDCAAARVEATASGQGQLSDNSPVLFPPHPPPAADGLPALAFSISSLTLIGMLAVITYTVSCAHQRLISTVIMTKCSMRSS